MQMILTELFFKVRIVTFVSFSFSVDIAE